MRVVGLDLSLTATGVALAQPGSIRTLIIGSRPTGDTLPDRSLRLRTLVSKLWPYISTADLVVVEGPSFGSRDGHAHDRSGLFWLTLARATANHIPVAEVPPTTLKVFGTGKGNAKKDAVLIDVVRRYPDVDVEDNNAADALLLAAMGLHHLGAPYVDLPQTHTRALAAVAWPPNQRTGADA